MRNIVYRHEQTDWVCCCPLNLLDVNCLDLVHKKLLQIVAPGLKERRFNGKILVLKDAVENAVYFVSLKN